MTTEQLITLIDKIIWPVIIVAVYLLNIKGFRKIFNVLIDRIEKGAGVKLGNVLSIDAAPISLPLPKDNGAVTENHLGLSHSSWRYPKKDAEFGKKMYGIQVILQGQASVLDRVEYVRYSLHPSYPNQIQTKTNRERNFELKELAWGEFNIRAEVKIKEQQDLIKLTRYINLTETGPDLVGK